MLLKFIAATKTLLVFNFTDKSAEGFRRFHHQCQPKGQPAFYIFNNLQFERPPITPRIPSIAPRQH
jgi:hypothetical protein